MKRFFAVLTAALVAALLFAACGNQAGSGEASGTVDSYDGPWLGFQASFTREASSQYDNATLQVKYLDNGVALFQFDLMEGSEAEDRADTPRLAGTLLVDDEGFAGTYEGLKDDGTTAFAIRFELAEDGQAMAVTHTGDLPISPDGAYNYVDAFVECSEGMARALIENLPTAATSLNSGIGAYTLNYPEEYVLNYFYPVTATFDDTGAVLAAFIVTDDLSAVYRLDTEDGVPVLIYGEAQTMLDQVIYLPADGGGEAVSLLPVVLDGGTLLAPGKSAKLTLEAPYPFACAFRDLLSTDDAVAAIDADGTVRAITPGTASISGTLAIDDGTKGFLMDITVT